MNEYTLAKQYLKWFLITSALLTGIMLLGLLGGCYDYARAQDIDLEIISFIESSNNPLAYNKKSGASGMYQLMPCVVDEYNARHPASKIAFKAVFNPVVARTVAKWYLTSRIPQMLRYYHKPVTLQNILICYNAGIRAVVNGYMPQETKNYIRKYAKLAKGDK